MGWSSSLRNEIERPVCYFTEKFPVLENACFLTQMDFYFQITTSVEFHVVRFVRRRLDLVERVNVFVLFVVSSRRGLLRNAKRALFSKSLPSLFSVPVTQAKGIARFLETEVTCGERMTRVREATALPSRRYTSEITIRRRAILQ